MARKPNPLSLDAWTLDQLAKSAFFHRKLHEWRLIEISDEINAVQGERLEWDHLNISHESWNKMIHRGIKPVIVFAHPSVLQDVPGAVGYYRMLAMVSQKSMKRVGLNVDVYEARQRLTDERLALSVAQHLNRIISLLIETDETINAREFDLWRGMAAGSQAQGSWQNNKGSSAEITIQELVLRRLQEQEMLIDSSETTRKTLSDGRTLIFADDPDIAFYEGKMPHIAIEIKGGIDPAAVLERIGATLKSLRRIRLDNPQAITILILQDVSMTEQAKKDLSLNIETVTYLFSTTSLIEDDTERERFFTLLRI